MFPLLPHVFALLPLRVSVDKQQAILFATFTHSSTDSHHFNANLCVSHFFVVSLQSIPNSLHNAPMCMLEQLRTSAEFAFNAILSVHEYRSLTFSRNILEMWIKEENKQ